MIIVAGRLLLDPGSRASYLDGCHEVVRLARAAPGCLEFALSADPLDPARINVFERWETVADVEAYRGSAPSTEQTAEIRDADVRQFEVASSRSL